MLARAAVIMFALSKLTPSLYQSGSNNQPFQLELSPAAVTAELNQEVDIAVILTNTSNSPETFRASFKGTAPEFFYDISLHSDDGSSVEETKYERSVKGHGTIALDYNSKFVTLRPGEHLTEHVNISKLFSLNKAGSYQIQATRPFRDLDKNIQSAKSNVVTLKITP